MWFLAWVEKPLGERNVIVMSNRFRVYTKDIEELWQYGEVFEPIDYRSWVILVSDKTIKEIELVQGVFRVISIP